MGHFLRQAAQLAQVGGAGLMEDGAGGKEQQALEEGVVHGMVQSGRHAQGGAQANSGEHIADLGDAVEGQQALEVMLGQRHGNTDEHAERADKHQQKLHGAQVHGLEQEIGQPDDAVDTGLGQHAGDHHGDGSGSRAVGVRRQGVEGHDEGLGAEAHEQQGEGHLGGGVQVAGNHLGQLGQVQGMGLGIEHGSAHQDAGGADAAHHQVLEGSFQRALGGVAESGERHGREGQDLHHDEHIEQVAGQDQTHHAAAQHQKQGVILPLVIVMTHILDGVHAGDEDRDRHQQGEEQAEGVHLQGDADGVAAGGDTAAHPVGNDLPVPHDGLDQGQDEGQGGGNAQQGQDVPGRAVAAENNDKESAQKQHHDGINGEVLIAEGIENRTHPRSLLISLVSVVPYCSSSLMTRARDMAVTQAPITMLVRVRAWGMGSTKKLAGFSSVQVKMGAVPPGLKPMDMSSRFTP